MKIRCEYCGQYIQDTQTVCPFCGAPNNGVQRSGVGVPKTIEQLKAFCARHNLPLDQMRFFIGQDYREPKAFGIYRDEDGRFVVYKNKADGSRAIRYHGTDEAYAVNEIYQKMKSEISKQRGYAASPASQRGQPSKKKRSFVQKLLLWFVFAFFGFGLLSGIVAMWLSPGSGYYRYNGGYYYNQSDDWYYYDENALAWVPTVIDEELENNYSDYFESDSYSDGYGIENFDDSEYYRPSSGSSDWDDDWDDSDWDWDSGSSWDSGSTDWDSDW